MPKISVCVPFHWMKDWEKLLYRCIKSIESQDYPNYEVILIKHSNMPVTSNRVIDSATGDIIKLLYMDDYFSHGHALTEIAGAFHGGWLVSGCIHDDGRTISNYHQPNIKGIENNINTIGSPSVLAFEGKCKERFDEKMSWLLDVDLYKRLYKLYGEPTILDTPNVTIGIHEGQMTNILTDEEKNVEFTYLLNKKI